jgi:hypothetical protein
VKLQTIVAATPTGCGAPLARVEPKGAAAGVAARRAFIGARRVPPPAQRQGRRGGAVDAQRRALVTNAKTRLREGKSGAQTTYRQSDQRQRPGLESPPQREATSRDPSAMESQNLIRWLMLVGAAWRGGFDAPESVPVRGIFSCAPPTP